jgi:LDH2 family malate/lactate/ureidoglycolate dehydrogenase
LVLSNLLGVDSHGIVRIRNYMDSIRVGAIVPGAQPAIVRDNGVSVLMDGRKAFGQIVAQKAAALALERAQKHAIGVVSFTDVYHIGRLGEYVHWIAERGLLAIMLANGSRPGGLVTPFGARQRMLGTNPIAFAIPAGSQPILVADFSTSAVAEGKVRIALRNEEQVPSGWLIDRDGMSTTDPNGLYEGGSILCFGGHKGYALSLLVEVLGGILSGADTPAFPDYAYMHNGVFLMAIQPEFFRPGGSYKVAVDFLFSTIKGALPAQGSQGPRIPGEPEMEQKIIREREGVPVDAHTWAELLEVAAGLNVNLEAEIAAPDDPLHAGSQSLSAARPEQA